MNTKQFLAELAAFYGSPRFSRHYAETDPALVERIWDRALVTLLHGAVEYGLRNLPEGHIPTPTEFRTLALQQPSTAAQPSAGPVPPADPQRVAQALAWRPKPRHPKQWTYDLRQRELEGVRLTLAQKTMWRVALGLELHHHAHGAVPPQPID